MKVYALEVIDGVQHLLPVNSADWERFDRFGKVRFGDAWPPIRVRVVEETKDNPTSDFPYLLPHVPVFSDRAVRCIGTLLRSYGEILPLDMDTGTFFAMNVLSVLPAIDEERSSLRRSSRGKIIDISRHEFIAEVINGAAMFMIPQRASMVYVTEEFVKAVSAFGLTGFHFRTLWHN